MTAKTFTVCTTVHDTVENCWRYWTSPAAILQFNNPFEGWHTAKVETDFREGGRLYYRMEAMDGSDGFDFAGMYTKIIPGERIESLGDDGRTTVNTFVPDNGSCIISEIVEPDAGTPLELQQRFCQGLLDSFKLYTEQQKRK